MLNRILKILIALPLIVIMLFIVIVNVKLGYRPAESINGRDTANLELLKELRGLKKALREDADIRMQEMYPEGYIFLNAIYAITWCNFLHDHNGNAYQEEGLAEIQEAWLKIDSPTGKDTFDPELPFPYGSFYNGWSTYVLGSKLGVEDPGSRNESEVEYFKQQCTRISLAIEKMVYPMSYTGGAWPADAVMCVASLSLHDGLFEPEYEEVIRVWVSKVKGLYDINGMIPHSVRPFDGKTVETARGSSQALMLMFLRDIDASLASEQFRMFKERFVDTKFGLTGIREYPKGALGTGDIDSGPVVLGFGGVATIVGMQTLSIYGEHDLSYKISNTVEALGFAIENKHEKKYFLGLLPIADAFIAWSHSNITRSDREVSFPTFRVYSAVAFLLLSVFFWSLVSGSKPDSKQSLTIPW